MFPQIQVDSSGLFNFRTHTPENIKINLSLK